MKTWLKTISIFIFLLTQVSCSTYTVYNYKYGDYVGFGAESGEELYGKLIFYCPTDIVYERITKTGIESKEVQINERKRQEVDKYLTYKDRIVVPKGTKGVYYDDEDFPDKELNSTSTRDYDYNKARIWIDFGDSIVIPFESEYIEYSSLSGNILGDIKENSKGITRIDRYNLRLWKNNYFTSEKKFTIPHECISNKCVEYERRGIKYGYLSCRNWKKYNVRAKTIDEEIINEKKAKGKTIHNY